MIFEIPLDLGFCEVFTGHRSGERTPTGTVRKGLRPIPHRPRGESGIGARTVFTATSNRAGGLLRETGGDGEVARSRRNWGHPNWTQRVRFHGTRNEGSGNRVSVKRCHGFEIGRPMSNPNAASPAAPNGETGDVNRSRRRLAPDHRPVVDLSTRAAPEGAQARARSADRGAFVFDVGLCRRRVDTRL